MIPDHFEYYVMLRWGYGICSMAWNITNTWKYIIYENHLKHFNFEKVSNSAGAQEILSILKSSAFRSLFYLNDN